MPFLHYESDERRRKMSNAIKAAKERVIPEEKASGDVLLLHAYLRSHQLQPRRTLDQFFYHGIDTSERDADQVVYRYSKKHHRVTKVFMVDQLWLWVLGRGKIKLGRPDLRNPYEGIRADVQRSHNNKLPSAMGASETRSPEHARRNHRRDQCEDAPANPVSLRPRYADHESMFGAVRPPPPRGRRVSVLGHVRGVPSERSRTVKASSSGASIVRPLCRLSGSRTIGRMPANHHLAGATPVFPDALLDIGVETSLLAEIKDIRDELNILAVILESQMTMLWGFENGITDELRLDGTRRATDAITSEIRKRSREQKRVLEVHQKDIDRMDRQAESIYMSLTHLLDLKQKHSNALEARFARDHAVIAARQGQTIMVFTIVTIIFLPMSFIAAFFAINLEDWNGTLTIAYVTKYMFGIGLGISIPLIIMAFTVRDIFYTARNTIRTTKTWFFRRNLPTIEKPNDSEDDVTASETTHKAHFPQSLAEDRSFRPRTSNAQDMSPRGLDYSYARPGASPLRISRDRRLSVGAPTGVSWARPSFDRRRGRLSDDVERGRHIGSSQGY